MFVFARQSADRKQRVEEYLAKLVPGVQGVDVRAVGTKETLEFRQEMAGAEHGWRFLASSMSEAFSSSLRRSFGPVSDQAGKAAAAGWKRPPLPVAASGAWNTHSMSFPG